MGWAIALHGGAGMVSKAMPAAQREASEATLNEFLDAGIAALNDSRSALEVVELVVRLLENCPMFNSGVGSVLTSKGTVEMEASIMDGATKKSGAVSGLSTVVNPISLARLVMEKTRHVYLAFDGAEAFARAQGVETKDPSYFITEENQERLRKALKTGAVMLDHCASNDELCETEKVHTNGIHSNGVHSNGVHDAKRAHSNGISESAKVHSNGNGVHSNGRVSDADKAQFETVGCVAVDVYGNCAAATSTGGLVNKMVGRIGDTPLIGAGTYADENCAVSVTGKGEVIIQALVAKDVSALMEYKYLRLKEAVDTVVWKKLAEGTAGLIAVSASGEVTMSFNTLGMYRASATEDGLREVGIWDDVFSEDEDTKPEPVKYSLIN